MKLKRNAKRNAPCACGSGKKYIKCCGSVPRSPTAAGKGNVAPSPVNQAVQECLRGDSLFSMRRYGEALAAYYNAAQFGPLSADAYNKAGIIHMQRSEFDHAFAAFQRALQVDPGFVFATINSGNALHELGRYNEAVAFYDKALLQMPLDSKIHTNKGWSLVHAYRPDAALRSFRRATEIDPDNILAYVNQTPILIEQGKTGEAEKLLLEVLSRHPDHLDILTCLATLYERRNQLEEAEVYARKMLDRDPLNPVGSRIMAGVLRRQGKAGEGVKLLYRVTIPADDSLKAMRIHREFGRLYERLHENDLAMKHFVEANRLCANPQQFKKENYLNMVRETRQWFEGAVSGQTAFPPATTASRVPTPYFQVGFPRSGSTLLHQILECDPAIQVSEEKPMLENVKYAIMDRHGNYPQSLLSLTGEELEELRGLYWQDARQHGISSDRQLVDKLPLNIVNCALIARLFPGARVIVNLRHPCDVCLSCFMREFEGNEAMENFNTLEDTVNLYVQVMGLWQLYERVLPLSFHRFHYEGLIENFQKEVSSLVEYLGIPWTDDFLAYHNRAKTKNIATPSYSQVVEPIYSRASYRWLRYRKYFEPYLDKLGPLIEAFGYPSPD